MRPDAVQRVLDAELVAARERRGGAAPRVVDVGGGSGVWAVPLAVAGCTVTVIEPSPNALATLQRRAAEAGVSDRVTATQGDSDALTALVPAGSADLVLGHGMLEVVDEVKTAIAAMAETVAPGGAVSVLVANRFAAVLHRAIAGRLVDARRLLDDPAGELPGAGDQLLRRFDTEGLRQVLTDAGLAVELVQGYGVLSDLVPGAVLESQPGAADSLAELELVAATTPQLRDVASQLHAIARKPSN
ncbi:2-polyprenyl-3-methyl-5-hydroxy-6-metoxy-1,4-benzoquinol methylase [Herbihabitans rhizosphaerae]|uniref:2-polyprenyl-3-methyl-5-hydroxy-6-metoxy-1, 4-benzoquinol methylase n=1 Tax=Herbihabitans rhizosphaerae TaxID=1872711 RepID=A0A4Q7KIM2_9PSEU|nr:methyltransferase domain-containing protein [Herbihabitans rhizosphaerae]RZS34781.1 2-polyprenyl-3-methyl-5-hydroxy-6-metoxy-1,4-benzoquinol methylase [Herbihabitans rhizosphaerae]